ncbi:MAG: hypothetical protein EPO21_17835 [Chloroflexota bacterium]|nr:MAG: hypothetical protein EPO21_17835 [Chloroflexota bacterium]
MGKEQFLITWGSRGKRGRGGSSGVRQSSPRNIAIRRIVVGLLAIGLLVSSVIEVPQHVSGLAKVVPGSGGTQAGDDVQLVVFLPADSQSRLHSGQTVLLQSDVTGERLRRAVADVEREILSPEDVRKRLGLGAAASVQSSALVVARFEPSPTDVPASTYAGRVYRAEVELAPRRLIALLPPIAQILGLFDRNTGPATLASASTVDQSASTARTQESARGIEPGPAGGLGRDRPDARTEYDAIVSEQILQTLHDYERIPVDVPRLDPRSTDQSATTGSATRIYVRTPYQLNTKKAEAKQLKNIAESSLSLQALFGQLPIMVRQGKGSPALIQSAVQGAVELGEIRGGSGDWPPERTDIERWMNSFGIGIDCSAFVYEALSRVDSALSSKGKPGLVRPLDGAANEVDNNDLSMAGEPIVSPAELKAGDLMNLDAEEYEGHIRIVTSAQRQGKSVVFATAEAAEASINGTDAKQWRFPDPSRFADLEQYEDGEWHRASARDQTYTYWRRLPLISGR